MYFVTQLPRTARGHTAIMVVVDRLSKQVHLIPTRDQATARQTAQIFLERVFAQHGMPVSIVSDRDSKFTSEFWQELMGLLGTTLKMSSARHPETDGQSERTIRTISQYLRSFVKYNQKDWDSWLPLAEFYYNSAVHRATGLSPFQVTYGRQPLTPLAFTKAQLDYRVQDVGEMLKANQQVRVLCKRALEGVGLGPFAPTEEVVTREEELAREAILKSQEVMRQQANKHRRDISFKEGEKVLLATKEFDRNQYTSRPSRKLGPKYIGPYKIEKVIGEGAYKLALPKALALYPVFHASQLRKYFDPEEFPERPKKHLQTDFVKKNKKLELEEVLNHRVKAGVLQYRVKWQGSTEEAWIPAKKLENAHELILAYENKQAEPKEEEEGEERECNALRITNDSGIFYPIMSYLCKGHKSPCAVRDSLVF